MVEINNLTSEKIDSKRVESVILATLKKEGSNFDVSVAFVDPDEIKGINNKYRKIDRATDVLSFEELSEIIICPKEVRKNGKSFEDELIKVLIHGTLHLLGYDHEKDNGEMLERQDQYFQLLKSN